MTTPDEALVARWRRLEASINRVRAAVDSPDPHQCPDAVAVALNDLYDLWELWARKTRLTFKDQDNAIRGDTCGEVTAALVHARGGKSHVFVEFGNFTNTYSNTYFSLRLLAMAIILGPHTSLRRSRRMVCEAHRPA